MRQVTLEEKRLSVDARMGLARVGTVEAGVYWVMGQKINFVGGPSSNNLGSVMFLFGNAACLRLERSGLPGHFATTTRYRSRTTVNGRGSGNA